jgi:DNA-binding response OmpR family regulator
MSLSNDVKDIDSFAIKNKQALKLYGRSKSILIVDKDSSLQELLANIINPFITNIDFAKDANEALDKFKIDKYDIIIIDSNLSEINGLKLSEEIRKKDVDQAIIISSVDEDKEFFVKLIDLKIDAFISKPFEPNIILEKILKILEEISYRSLMYSLKRDQIIKDFVSKDSQLKEKCQIKKNTNREKFYEYCAQPKEQVRINPPIVVDNTPKEIKSPQDIKSAKDLFEYLDYIKVDKEFINSQVDLLVVTIQCLENYINDLLIFAENIEVQLGFDKCEDAIIEIARKMSVIYYALQEFKVLGNIAETFFELHVLFDGYRALDDITPEEIEGFISMKYLFKDIKRFVEAVFVNKTEEDIFIFDQLFKSNLEQLETNLKPQTEKEEDDDGDLFFF